MSYERSRRRLIAAVVATLLLTCMVFIYVGTLDYAHDRTRALLHHFENTTGMRIEINNHEFSTRGARFHDIKFGDGNTGRIGAILADLTLNPLSANFGSIKKLRIQDLRFESTLNQLQEQAQQLLSNRKMRKASKGDSQAAKRLPQDILLNNSVIRILDNHNRPLLVLEDVDARFVARTGKLVFKVAAVYIRNAQLTGEIRGELDAAKPLSHWPFNIESTEHTQGWQISGKIKRDLSGLQVATSFAGLRGPIAAYVSKVVVDPGILAGNISTTVAIDHKSKQLRYLTEADIKRGVFQHPVVATQPFRLPFRLKARGGMALDATQFRIDDGFLAVRSIDPASKAETSDKLKIWFNATHTTGPDATVKLAVNIPPTQCQDALEALPEELAATLQSFKMTGALQMSATLAFDPRALDKFTIDVPEHRWDCQVRSSDFAFARERLAQPFTFTNPYEPGVQRLVGAQQNTATYTNLAQIAENLKLALLSAEDMNFWEHSGFEASQIVSALRENLKQHRIAIGGSTISMQTAKNLFLNRERTLARKAQEAFLTWHLEETLSKERIMEIYLNIIEFGPGIFGITQAARHYFNKLPRDLSLLESTYLVSLLPSPIQRYSHYCAGRLTHSYEEMLDNRLDRMLKLDLISNDENRLAKNEQLHFSNAHLYSKQSCLEKIARRAPPAVIR